MSKSIPAKFRILPAAQILILILMIVMIFIRQNAPLTADLTNKDLTDNNPANKDLTYTNLDLPPGSYSLIIDYTAADDVYFTLSGTGGRSGSDDVNIRGRYGFLRYHNRQEVLHFRTHDRLSSFSIEPATTEGLEISSVRIVKNCDYLSQALVFLIVIFISADLLICFILRRGTGPIKDNLSVIITLTAVTLAASLPLFIPGIVSGYDFATHIMRIESIYYDLKAGAFPVRINSIYLRNYSYPFSVYYGDILLYPTALLRMAGFDITEAWKIYFFVMNAATAAITYLCTNRMFRNRGLALVLSCAYTTAPYRLANLYSRGAVGEFTAMSIHPIIALSVYMIYTRDLTPAKSRKYSTVLALAMSLLVCTHLLSTEMVVFTLVIIALILFKKTFSKKVFLTFVSAAFKTVLLSLFFVVPFLDYYISTPTIISDIVSNQAPTIQDYGVRLWDFFTLPLTRDASYASPGIIFTAALIIGVIILAISGSKIQTKIQKDDKSFLLLIVPLSLLLAVMSTRYFPWDFLGLHTRFGKFAGQIQFPFRFIGILSIMLLLVLGLILKNLPEKYTAPVKYVIYAISAAISIMIFCVSLNEVKTMMFTNTCQLDSETVGSGEYVLSGTNIWYREINDNLLAEANTGTVTDIRRNGTGLILECSTSDTPHDILAPKYAYKGYRAYDRDGNRLGITNGPNNLISLTLPAGYEGPVYIKYVEPRYWRLAEIISLITLIVLILQYARSSYPGSLSHDPI